MYACGCEALPLENSGRAGQRRSSHLCDAGSGGFADEAGVCGNGEGGQAPEEGLESPEDAGEGLAPTGGGVEVAVGAQAGRAEWETAINAEADEFNGRAWRAGAIGLRGGGWDTFGSVMAGMDGDVPGQ